MTDNQELKELQKFAKYISAVHATDELPLQFGSVEQQERMLQRVGEWKKARFTDPNVLNDDMYEFYYGEPVAERILTGRDLPDTYSNTPVGKVALPAPAHGIFSPFYPASLAVQFIEETYKLIKPSEPDRDFLEWVAGSRDRAKARAEAEELTLKETVQSATPETTAISGRGASSYSLGISDSHNSNYYLFNFRNEEKKRTTRKGVTGKRTTRKNGEIRYSSKDTVNGDKYVVQKGNINHYDGLCPFLVPQKKETPKEIWKKMKQYVR